MKSLSFEFNQAAANRQYLYILFLMVMWYIFSDDADKRKKRERQRHNAACKPPRRKGPSP